MTKDTYLLCRSEELVKDLLSSQRQISTELSEKQAYCQELQGTMEDMEGEIQQAEESRRQVRPENLLVALSHVAF